MLTDFEAARSNTEGVKLSVSSRPSGGYSQDPHTAISTWHPSGYEQTVRPRCVVVDHCDRRRACFFPRQGTRLGSPHDRPRQTRTMAQPRFPPVEPSNSSKGYTSVAYFALASFRIFQGRILDSLRQSDLAALWRAGFLNGLLTFVRHG